MLPTEVGDVRWACPGAEASLLSLRGNLSPFLMFADFAVPCYDSHTVVLGSTTRSPCKVWGIFNFAGVSPSLACLTALIFYFFSKMKRLSRRSEASGKKRGLFLCMCMPSLHSKFWNRKSLSRALQEGNFWLICALGALGTVGENSDPSFLPWHIFR